MALCHNIRVLELGQEVAGWTPGQVAVKKLPLRWVTVCRHLNHPYLIGICKYPGRFCLFTRSSSYCCSTS